MSDERPDLHEIRNYPDDKPFPELKQFVGMRIEFDLVHGIASLSLQGPTVPVVDMAASIGFGRDAGGKYHLLIGGGDYAYPLSEIPIGLRRLLVRTGSSEGHPVPMRLPSKQELQYEDKSVITYLPYEQYKFRQKMFHSLEDTWIPLPPALYQALIDFYSGKKISRPLKKR